MCAGKNAPQVLQFGDDSLEAARTADPLDVVDECPAIRSMVNSLCCKPGNAHTCSKIGLLNADVVRNRATPSGHCLQAVQESAAK